MPLGRFGGGGFGGMGYPAASRFDEMTHFGSSYGTPGWQRAQRAKDRRGGRFDEDPETYLADEWDTGSATASPPPFQGGRGRAKSRPRLPLTIEG